MFLRAATSQLGSERSGTTLGMPDMHPEELKSPLCRINERRAQTCHYRTIILVSSKVRQRGRARHASLTAHTRPARPGKAMAVQPDLDTNHASHHRTSLGRLPYRNIASARRLRGACPGTTPARERRGRVAAVAVLHRAVAPGGCGRTLMPCSPRPPSVAAHLCSGETYARSICEAPIAAWAAARVEERARVQWPFTGAL